MSRIDRNRMPNDHRLSRIPTMDAKNMFKGPFTLRFNFVARHGMKFGTRLSVLGTINLGSPTRVKWVRILISSLRATNF